MRKVNLRDKYTAENKIEKSIFSIRWFRILLSGLILVVIILLIMPSLMEFIPFIPPRSVVVLQPQKPVAPRISKEKKTSEEPKSTEPRPLPSITEQTKTIEKEIPKVSPLPQTKIDREVKEESTSKDIEKPIISPKEPEKFALQLGAYYIEKNADELTEKARNDGLTVEKRQGLMRDTFYKMYLKRKYDDISIKRIEEQLKKDKLEFFIEEERSGEYLIRLYSEDLKFKDAIERSRELRAKGYDVRLKKMRKNLRVYYVRIGRFDKLKDAIQQRDDIQAKGYDVYIVKE